MCTSSCYFFNLFQADPGSWQTRHDNTSRHTVITLAHTRECHPLPVTPSAPESRQRTPDFVPVPHIHSCFKAAARLKRACTLHFSPLFFFSSSAPPCQLCAAQLLEFEWDGRRWEELLKRCWGYIDLTYPCLRVHGATPHCEECKFCRKQNQTLMSVRTKCSRFLLAGATGCTRGDEHLDYNACYFVFWPHKEKN